MHPFRIDIPQQDLDDLNNRLTNTRWPGELPDAAWNYGVNQTYLQDLVTHWQQNFNWREHEAHLNELPQFTTTIDNQRIHFLHIRSPEPDATP